MQVSFKMKVLLFLYGSKNLVGCALALAGLAMFFAGVIDDWWLPIVAGLYAVGWLAVPADRELEVQVRNEATQADLVEGMAVLVKDSRAKLPREAVERLERIQSTVVELAPKLFDGGMAMDYAISLINAVTRDLPETVRNYVHLPTAFANLHVIQGGKTCKELLVEQLDLLNSQLAKIAENVYKDDADALVVNGKFLQEKFHSLSFVG
ncbi:hypothetical protein [Rugamonas aquatica]|uniref:5-bromo-4-chloroindolyl phosphate hydrolase n=1 Tax=Rugamonas aquatica TaxID=2743357 RepID=A0A6A7MYE7_9BURK|nr:hypothetical protein [Rugamonas aquatica]MQA37767.1 hypothetical protein [Rugamonas aquatica]